MYKSLILILAFVLATSPIAIADEPDALEDLDRDTLLVIARQLQRATERWQERTEESEARITALEARIAELEAEGASQTPDEPDRSEHASDAVADTPAPQGVDELGVWESEHYVVHTNLPREEASDLVEHLDMMFVEFGHRFARFRDRRELEHRLYLMRTQEDYARLLTVEH